MLGICNGFQILLEAGCCPGAMLRNRGLKFRCEHVSIRVEETDTPFTCGAEAGQVLTIPIAHGEGNCYAPPDVLQSIEAHVRWSSATPLPTGELDDAANPNGSLNGIAGLCNETRNVVGLMPHPERACEVALGSDRWSRHPAIGS